jgi:hypothetical protein
VVPLDATWYSIIRKCGFSFFCKNFTGAKLLLFITKIDYLIIYLFRRETSIQSKDIFRTIQLEDLIALQKAGKLSMRFCSPGYSCMFLHFYMGSLSIQCALGTGALYMYTELRSVVEELVRCTYILSSYL